MIRYFKKIKEFFFILFKKLNSFLHNQISILKQQNENFFNHKKETLLQNKKKKILESLPFEKKSPQSYALQRRLGLLVSNIDKIDEKDIQYLEYKRYGDSKKENPLTSYRIDFHNRDDLEIFKKKYKKYLL